MCGHVSDSLSRHSSVQGDSDSENESLIHTITNKLGSIFTNDSSEDADISETDDNDDTLDWTLDKPIFLTPHGPVKFRSGWFTGKDMLWLMLLHLLIMLSVLCCDCQFSFACLVICFCHFQLTG